MNKHTWRGCHSNINLCMKFSNRNPIRPKESSGQSKQKTIKNLCPYFISVFSAHIFLFHLIYKLDVWAPLTHMVQHMVKHAHPRAATCTRPVLVTYRC